MITLSVTSTWHHWHVVKTLIANTEAKKWKRRKHLSRDWFTFSATSLISKIAGLTWAVKDYLRCKICVNAGALVCVGFVHNLLRRHPACLVMLDRQDATGDNDIDRIEQNSLNAEPSLDSSMPINQTNGKAVETKPVSETNGVLPHKETNGAASRKEKKRKLRTKEIQEMVSDGIATMKSDEKSGNSLQHLIGADPFLEYEDDPAITRALESSLWELKSLSNHYYNQVSTSNIVSTISNFYIEITSDLQNFAIWI